ncbi:hypothetical protein PISMIDRAFT_329337 [Pisolithus microcarpus 441]|uniref:G domain-containing protein n=1 Tax=Pisolithus microcarpus 441 TaxID=765257 RepID=A0A0C9YFA5_9AGAM|nr:hypothetical protein PISMIDRAFT_329337 [Pisolithus microcarpus 441]
MVPNPQLCCMFSVSLYERYSSFTASLYPGIMGSTGSGRGNFIDKLAEPEGARAPHDVGSRTRDIREHAVKLYDHCGYVFVDTPGFKDSARYSEAKNHRADPAVLEEAQKVTVKFRCGTSNTSAQVVSVSDVRHLCPRMTHDQDCIGPHVGAWVRAAARTPHHERISQHLYELVVRCDSIGGPGLADTYSRDASRTRTQRVGKVPRGCTITRRPMGRHD